VAMRCVLNEDRVDPTKLTVVQHLSPACRDAQFNIASDLAAARILRSVDDVDKDDCKKVQNRLSAVVFLVLLIPVMLDVFDKSISDISFRSILTCVPVAALIVTYHFYRSIGLYFIIMYTVVVLLVIAVFWKKSMAMRKICDDGDLYWVVCELELMELSLRVHPNHHASMSFARYWYQTSIVDDSAEAWKLFNFPYHLHGVVVVSSKPAVIDENQELSSTINPPPVPLDLIPTEITNMTKGILWKSDLLLVGNSSNYLGELIQSPSDDSVRGAIGNKFDSENRRATFKRKYLTTDSAMGASRMILTNYRKLLFTNEVTLVDPTD